MDEEGRQPQGPSNAAAAMNVETGPAPAGAPPAAVPAAVLSAEAIAARPPIVDNPSEFEPVDDVLILENIGKNAAAVLGVLSNKNLLLPFHMRDHTDKSDAAVEQSKQDDIEQITEAKRILEPLGKLVELFLGQSVVDCLTKGGVPLRSAFEAANPQQQCNNVVLKVVLGSTPCWICGTVIPDMSAEEDRVDRIRRSPPGDYRKHPLSPECEHIFPVAQALSFTGLYEHELFTSLKRSGGINNQDAYIAGLQIEYRWAHRICNQVKNDTHFIAIRDEQWVYNQADVAPFVQSILASTEYQWPPLPNKKKGEVERFAGERRLNGGAIIKNHIGKTTPVWIQTRVVEIGKRTNEILDRVKNKTPDELARQSLKDFQAYAVFKNCQPVTLRDVLPVVLHVEQRPGDAKTYPDIYTERYLAVLEEVTLERLYMSCLQDVSREIEKPRKTDTSQEIEPGEMSLSKKGDILKRFRHIMYQVWGKMHRLEIRKSAIASYVLGEGGDWQTYQRVYYLTFLYDIAVALQKIANTHPPFDTTGPETREYDDKLRKIIVETLEYETKSLGKFAAEIVPKRPVNIKDALFAKTDPKYNETFKRWGIASGGGRRDTRRRKDRRKTHRRRKLPKLL